MTFEAHVAPMVWGKSTYAIVRLPPDILTAPGKTRRVEGKFNEHPVNLAITRAPVIDDPFLWAGKALLDKAGLEPGEIFEARLRRAPDDLVEMPPRRHRRAALRGRIRRVASAQPRQEARRPGPDRDRQT